MADTRPNIPLPADVWVNLYAATATHPQGAIPVGTQVIVKNEGASTIQLVTSATEPTAQPSGFVTVEDREDAVNQPGDSGAWARSKGTDGVLNVREV